MKPNITLTPQDRIKAYRHAKKVLKTAKYAYYVCIILSDYMEENYKGYDRRLSQNPTRYFPEFKAQMPKQLKEKYGCWWNDEYTDKYSPLTPRLAALDAAIALAKLSTENITY